MERKRYEIGNLVEGLEERAICLAQYMIEQKATVRQTASVFGVSKSTVHKDLTEKLPLINHALAAQVREVLDVNKSERHIRGGMATKDKYLREKNTTAFR
jgi:putative DeoR family transcriptional regulator (stage III sporulation protein D)